jgi:hypothetical protein
VLLIPDQGAVEQLAPAGPYPPLHDRVRAGDPDAAAHESPHDYPFIEETDERLVFLLFPEVSRG